MAVPASFRPRLPSVSALESIISWPCYQLEAMPILDVPIKAEGIKKVADDPEKCEYLVRVNWLKTVPEEQAYWEKGMIANQNSAFKLRNKFTLERLTKFFGLDE